ncbi:response regulator [Elusimicrobiota bacterium]
MSDKAIVLLVEDEEDIAKITSYRIETAGYEVKLAEDGKKALEMAKTENPDIILLDLNIPEITGKEVCLILKEDDDYKHIPIIILTASADDAKRVYRDIKANDYLIKPYEPNELLDKIKEYVDKSVVMSS